MLRLCIYRGAWLGLRPKARETSERFAPALWLNLRKPRPKPAASKESLYKVGFGLAFSSEQCFRQEWFAEKFLMKSCNEPAL